MARSSPRAEAHSPDPAASGAILTVDLDAIARNYRLLQRRLGRAACAAVLKADAYGLGLAQVAPVLHRAGCRSFFVAHLGEGIALRAVLPDAEIHVLHGLFPGTEAECAAHGLAPVLNSTQQVAAWAGEARRHGRRLPAAVQVDTGMARFGLAAEEVAAVGAGQDLAALDLTLVMSHLACADVPDDPANAAQCHAFADLRRRLPPARASLAASSGIFLSPEFHHDLARPGAALFGVAPTQGRPNPMEPVVRLDGRVVQVRTVPAGTAIGYGHTARTAGPARLATVAVGYADGFLRSAGNRACARHAGLDLPVLGRVSMDSIVLDVSALPEEAVGPGTLVELIGPERGVDDLARAAGTIGYEILTGLGPRYARRYLSTGDLAP